MSTIAILLLVVLNFGISWWNAKVTGQIWLESKAIGGMSRVMAWVGAIMAAIGFTYSFAIIVSFGLMAFGYGYIAQYVFALTYLLIIFPAIGTGIIVMIESWIRFFRERNLANLGVAGWNTFANAFNIYNAVDGIPQSVSILGGLFDDVDLDEDNLPLIVIGIVAFCLIGGILLTRYIIETNKGTLGVSQEVRDSHAPIR